MKTMFYQDWLRTNIGNFQKKIGFSGLAPTLRCSLALRCCGGRAWSTAPAWAHHDSVRNKTRPPFPILGNTNEITSTKTLRTSGRRNVEKNAKRRVKRFFLCIIAELVASINRRIAQWAEPLFLKPVRFKISEAWSTATTVGTSFEQGKRPAVSFTLFVMVYFCPELVLANHHRRFHLNKSTHATPSLQRSLRSRPSTASRRTLSQQKSHQSLQAPPQRA